MVVEMGWMGEGVIRLDITIGVAPLLAFVSPHSSQETASVRMCISIALNPDADPQPITRLLINPYTRTQRDMWLHFHSWETGECGEYGAIEETDAFRAKMSGSVSKTKKWLKDATDTQTRALKLLLNAGASLKAADAVRVGLSLFRPLLLTCWTVLLEGTS
jgi:hypothetical protein